LNQASPLVTGNARSAWSLVSRGVAGEPAGSEYGYSTGVTVVVISMATSENVS
jgi:hypothetical protein